ncbi:hypothetical protein LTR99_001847 [Exophiala xenobiotica]|uniref:Heterokaryon incompatibility domain-containing protein n=1 Tax=Vermiconidia calcicola TaxID=1690605 RepID=A0AAV9Q8Y3_9PEZI|nr:hypothetical protein LTR92_010507 [Exophiala xenobiotica]KAK5531108.1 hypothetical protein LTR23_010154 [Chaetothyriales sp. CCFEE 6169]KAK5536615.1 hypothetical protein LTR25_005289 [Vermiconidia calcicola]KAK5272455.1 hypothetical protein LTR96_002085 [Exophiala xenobiotica]KAK5306157.1 hypothetical protein LTR99_001847 [Exophiala xenobiotica]
MPPPQQPFFVYDLLHDPNNEIRLLEFQRTRKNNLLQFTLSATSINSAPLYTALSYESRSSNQDRRRILVNDTEFVVQQNLHDFLEQIYVHLKSRLPVKLWVDAICINQDTQDVRNEEKNHQIRLMGEIYSKAETVLVWFGDATWMYNPLIKTALQRCLNHWPFRDIFEQAASGPPWCLEDVGEVMLAAVMEPYDEDGGGGFFRDVVWELFEYLFNQSYWKRLWIIQELVFARSFAVLCGSHADRWHPNARVGLCLTKEELSAAYVLALGVRQGTIRLLKSLANDELDGQHQQSAAFLLGKAFKDWKDL